MSLWLAKSVVTEVGQRLGKADAGPFACEGVPRISKGLREIHPNLEVWDPEGKNIAALVVGNLAQGKDWETRLQAWRRTMVRGATLVSVDRGTAADVSLRLLCSGFTDLIQAKVGRRWVTSGVLVSATDHRLC